MQYLWMVSVSKKNKNKTRLTLLDKVNLCLTDFGDHVMHLVFQFQGQIDPQRMSQAVRNTLIDFPILAQRLVYSLGQPYWQSWSENELDKHLFCEVENTSKIDESVHYYMVSERDYSREPMINLRVFSDESQPRDDVFQTLCIKVSCVPIDGRGFLIFTQALLQAYEKLAHQNIKPVTPGSLALRSTKELLPRFQISDVPKVIFNGLRNQLEDVQAAKNWQFPYSSHASIDKAYYVHHFDRETFSALEAYRKDKGYTVNDMLLGAYYYALFELIEPVIKGPYSVLNTFDLRRYEGRDAPLRVANYSSFINTNVPIQEDDGYMAVVEKVAAVVKDRKSRYPGITEGPFIWPLFSCLPFALAKRIVAALLKRRGERIPVFTNVGKIDIGAMRINGQSVKNLSAFAPLEFPPKLTVTLATAGDIISLSVGFRKNHFSEPNIKQLFQRMETLIEAECNNNVATKQVAA